MLDHVLEKELVLCHSLKWLYQVGLKRKLVANPVRHAGKEVYPAFVHQPRLMGHVLEVHGVVEEVLFEGEKERAEFDGTFTTGLKLWKNYPAHLKQEYNVVNIARIFFVLLLVLIIHPQTQPN